MIPQHITDLPAYKFVFEMVELSYQSPNQKHDLQALFESLGGVGLWPTAMVELCRFAQFDFVALVGAMPQKWFDRDPVTGNVTYQLARRSSIWSGIMTKLTETYCASGFVATDTQVENTVE